MLQTNSIPGSGAPTPAADPAPEAPLRSTRAALLRTEDGIDPTAGKAPAARAKSVRKRSAATSTAGTAGYATSVSKDFAFLRDPKLTLEQKLMRFMVVMAKKLDEDIQRRMEELAPKDQAKKSSTSSSSKKSSQKGLLATVGKALSSVVKKPLQDLLKQVAGPVLAAGASALGFPALAPLLLKVGPALGQALGEAVVSLAEGGGSASKSVASSAKSTSTSSSKASGSAAGSTEERVKMMELQSVLEKQKEMVTLVSNMLRTFHDMRMSAINNIR
jgi:hypothetical protein